MIRKSQSLLLSVLLHGLIGAAFIVFIVPKMTSVLSSAPAHRYKIVLSRVAAVSPAAVTIEKPAAAVKPETKPRPAVRPKPVAAKPKPKAVRHVISKPKPLKKPHPKPKPKMVPEPRPDVPPPVEAEPSEPEAPAVSVQPKRKESAPAPQPTVSASAQTHAHNTAEPVVQTQRDYLNQHLAKIVALLQENLYYPRMARKRRIEGEVLVAFRLECDGTVHDLHIKRHARQILDRAAVETVASLSGKLPHPKNTLSIEVPIRFVLH